MIRLRPDFRGRPGTRQWVAETNSAREAYAIVRTLRKIGIEAKWVPELPYRVMVSTDRAREAVAYLEGRELEDAA